MIEKLKKDFPDKGWLWQRMSLIEETQPKMVRFDRLILYSCLKVNDATSSTLNLRNPSNEFQQACLDF